MESVDLRTHHQKMIDDLPARYAFQAVNSGQSFDDASEDIKNYWRKVAKAVTDSQPAPICGEIQVKSRYGGSPIVRHIRADKTVESVRAELKEVETWLVGLFHLL